MKHCSVLLFWAGASLFGAAPSWFAEFSTASHPAYPPKTKAVVLFSEERVQMDASGKQTTQIRKVIKILTAEGRSEAFGGVTYDQSGSKVREARAYLLYPGGKMREFARKDFTEGESNSGLYLYSSRKFLQIKADKEADPGSIFGFEITLEEKQVFSQFYFMLQDDLPTLKSRFQLTVPAGWSVTAKGYGGASEKFEQSGDTYNWEGRNLPPFDREPSSPGYFSQLPRVAIGAMPPTGPAVSLSDPVACFRSWQDVSRWKSALADPQAEVSQAIADKAQELTATIADQLLGNQLAKIQALAEYVQKIRYVAISTNTARGGGYVPHKADEVLRAAYGDCKDKANLLRALLKSINVTSWPVAIHSGDPRFTQEDFPSPFQFNHAILAISIPADSNFPAVYEDADLGRLLIFDPTDSHVAFGFLPVHEQNSLALLTAGETGKLIRTPQAPRGSNRTQRDWKMKLAGDGGLQGELVESTEGQDAFDNLSQSESLGPEQYRKALERWVANALPGTTFENLEYVYEEKEKRFITRIQFSAPSYAKVLRGKLWMLRSAPMPFFGTPNVNQIERTQPLIVRAVSFEESLTWEFPEHLRVDELPEAEEAASSFGSYQSRWTQQEKAVRVERSLELQDALLPAEEYAEARTFFSRFRGAEAAQMVLVAK